jgi:thiamine-phosphate pyrophosphorylase
VLPPGTWISRACHDVAAVIETDADAVLLSPIAAARKGRPALGVAGLQEARRILDAMPEARRPRLYALGGLDAHTAAGAIAAGADGIAVIGAVLSGDDPGPLLRVLSIVR